MKLLITGGNGFVGKHLQNAFKGTDHVIWYPTSKELDLTKSNSINTICEYGPDAIIHMAAKCGGILTNKNSPADFLRDNTQMALNVYEGARIANVKLVYSLGSVCSYPKYCLTPFKENDIWNGYPEETNAPYGISKRVLLMLGQTYREQYGIGGAHLIPVNMFGECFSKDTQIATINGLTNIADIKIGDKVYTLNPDTHEVEIENIILTQINKTNKFVNFKGSIIDLKVTPNHKIYYKTNKTFLKRKAEFFIPRAGKKYGMIRFATNKKLTTNIKYDTIFSMKDYIDNSQEVINNKVRDYKHSSSHWIPIEYNIEDFCQFIGWYVSEGSRIENRQINISQKAIVNDKNRKEIRQLLTRMNIPFGEDNERFYFSSKLWRNFIEKEIGIGSYNKQIPQFMMKLPPNLLELLFDSLMKGDGDKNGLRYTTTSDKLKDQLIILLMLIGKLPGKIHKEINANNFSCWRIPIRQLKTNSVKYKDITIENVENEDVYCITTEKNHIVYAGRNNKFCWVGQCDNFDLTTSHVIPALIRKFDEAIKNGTNVECWGSGDATREFIYSGDTAQAIVKAVSLNFDSPLPINLGTGQDISIKKLAYLIGLLMDFKGEIVFKNEGLDGQPKRMLDVSRAKELLDWEAKVSLRIGLLKTIEWYRLNLKRDAS